MSLSLFLGVTLAVLLISWLERSKLKTKKDRAVFAVLVLFVWFMSMLDLPNMPGPPQFLNAVFRPFQGWLKE